MVHWREDRIGSAHRGENAMVMARRRYGFAVIGDTQHLPGYALLLCDDAPVDHLTGLDWPRRTRFLLDLVPDRRGHTGGLTDGLRRIDYGDAERSAPAHAYSDDIHGELRSRIARQLKRLMSAAYVGDT
jgi:hypothetical protein